MVDLLLVPVSIIAEGDTRVVFIIIVFRLHKIFVISAPTQILTLDGS